MKKPFRLVSTIILMLFLQELSGQTAYRDQEFSIRNDNDVYTFRDSDKYYSNGIILNYRWVVKPGKMLSPSRLNDSTKVIIETELSHKFFTPRFLFLEDVEDFDRPYAGTLSAGYYVKVFPKKDREFRYGADLTLIGSASGAEGFQTWYHEYFGFPIPQGWDYQIPNELTINFKGSYLHQFKLVGNAIDLVSETSATLGSALINAKQMVDFRFGRLQALHFSSFTNSLIGRGSRNFLEQSYFFAGLGVEYVAHNITIQGSLWNNNAPHIENIVPWIRHMRFGMAFNGDRSTFKLVYNWLGPEVKNLKWHSYFGLELQLRFVPKEDRKKARNR